MENNQPPTLRNVYVTSDPTSFSQPVYQQRITYPCGCELVGPSPMPVDCPTHGAYIPIEATKPVESTGKQEILLNVVLDESGSMSINREKTIDAINEYLSGLRQDQNADYLVTLTKFDACGKEPACRVLWKTKPLAEVPTLTGEDYRPRGTTPLYDAIGATARTVEQEAKGRPVLTVIVSDGYENASKEFTLDQIRALIEEKEKRGNWTFVYLGADLNAWAAASPMGLSSANVASYQGNNVQETMKVMSGLTRGYSAMRSMMPQDACFANTGYTFSDSATGGVRGGISGADTPFYAPYSNLSGAAGSGPGSAMTQADMSQAGVAARREKLTKEQRVEIAQKAARARWKNRTDKS